MLNVDPIQKMLKENTGISVHGIIDSGWFLDQQPYLFNVDRKRASIDIVKQGIHYWHSQIPCKCRSLYAPEEHAKCFIGYIIYPTISSKPHVYKFKFFLCYSLYKIIIIIIYNLTINPLIYYYITI